MRSFARHVVFAVTAVVTGVPSGFADDVTPIGTVLKNPESYYLHMVTFAGTVRQVKVLPLPFAPPQPCNPIQGGNQAFYRPITFTLEDESGSIVVDRLSTCGPQGQRVPEVNEGQKIVIEAQILGPEKGRPTAHAVLKVLRRG